MEGLRLLESSVSLTYPHLRWRPRNKGTPVMCDHTLLGTLTTRVLPWPYSLSIVYHRKYTVGGRVGGLCCMCVVCAGHMPMWRSQEDVGGPSFLPFSTLLRLRQPQKPPVSTSSTPGCVYMLGIPTQVLKLAQQVPDLHIHLHCQLVLLFQTGPHYIALACLEFTI